MSTGDVTDTTEGVEAPAVGRVYSSTVVRAGDHSSATVFVSVATVLVLLGGYWVVPDSVPLTAVGCAVGWSGSWFTSSVVRSVILLLARFTVPAHRLAAAVMRRVTSSLVSVVRCPVRWSQLTSRLADSSFSLSVMVPKAGAWAATQPRTSCLAAAVGFAIPPGRMDFDQLGVQVGVRSLGRPLPLARGAGGGQGGRLRRGGQGGYISDHRLPRGENSGTCPHKFELHNPPVRAAGALDAPAMHDRRIHPGGAAGTREQLGGSGQGDQLLGQQAGGGHRSSRVGMQQHDRSYRRGRRMHDALLGAARCARPGRRMTRGMA